MGHEELHSHQLVCVSHHCTADICCWSGQDTKSGTFALNPYHANSLIPRLPDLFNVAQEKWESLVKLIMCVTSGGTNFHIWHNSKLAKIKATDAKSSSSSINILHSAMNQQAETLQSLFYESKTTIYMVT